MVIVHSYVSLPEGNCGSNIVVTIQLGGHGSEPWLKIPHFLEPGKGACRTVFMEDV